MRRIASAAAAKKKCAPVLPGLLLAAHHLEKRLLDERGGLGRRGEPVPVRPPPLGPGHGGLHRPLPAAIALALEGLPAPARVADIGCGTGIASRLFAAQGAAVIGIDPNAEMLERARSAGAPTGTVLEYRQGTGEEMGLRRDGRMSRCVPSPFSGSTPGALPEFHRILRPGGRLVLMWNKRSDTDPFTAGFSRILKVAQAEAKRTGRWQARNALRHPTASGRFGNARTRSFRNPQALDLPGPEPVWTGPCGRR